MDKLEYDKNGRLKYSPEFHCNTGKPWTTSEIDYLVNWYEIIGPDEMSFALERTITSTMQRVADLRKQGKMLQTKNKYHRRICGVKS